MADDRGAHLEQRDRLVDAGLLVPMGIDGLYGRSSLFESIVSGLEDLVLAQGVDQDAVIVRFPPLVARKVFEKSGYLESFPTLTGSVYSFEGDDDVHRRLLQRLDVGGDWTTDLVSTNAVLCAAACHPLYPTIRGPVGAGGRTWNVYGQVFRHEPSVDPARMQTFRQYEYVYVGEPEGALRHRDTWLARALGLLDGLGLDVASDLANDPFFGRAGRMLATNQRDDQLKFEVVAATSGADKRTAIASANCHQDHFGAAFNIITADGQLAHSACVGFGMERITLALLWEHGLDVDEWPATVRTQLWPGPCY